MEKAHRATQIVMAGVVTEEDVVRAYMRRIGSKGGSRGTPAQLAQRRKAAQRMRAERKRKARGKR